VLRASPLAYAQGAGVGTELQRGARAAGPLADLDGCQRIDQPRRGKRYTSGSAGNISGAGAGDGDANEGAGRRDRPSDAYPLRDGVGRGGVGDEISLDTIFRGCFWFLGCEVIIMTC
jgi:hypothetical protein